MAENGYNGKKGDFKGDGSVDALFQGNIRNLKCSRLFTSNGTLCYGTHQRQ